MHEKIAFIVITFIVIIAIIILSDTLAGAVTLIALIVNLLVISNQLGVLDHGLTMFGHKTAPSPKYPVHSTENMQATELDPYAENIVTVGSLAGAGLGEGFDRSGQFNNSHRPISENRAERAYKPIVDDSTNENYGMHFYNWQSYERPIPGANTACDLRQYPPVKLHSGDANVYLDYSNDIDAKTSVAASARSRDKRAMTSAITKGADYYKYHFGDEMLKSEKKTWWGEYDAE